MDMFDFNTAESQRDPTELIPANTVALVMLKVRPGGQGPGGYLKNNNDGNCLMADCELTVLAGPYAKRKFWGLYIVDAAPGATEGQKKAVDISRGTFRSILESARGILPAADDAASMEARKVKGWADFDGIIFCAKIGVEQGELKDKGGPANGERYGDKNKLVCAVTPDSRQYISPSDPAAAAAAASAGSVSNQQGGFTPPQQQAPINKPTWAS